MRNSLTRTAALWLLLSAACAADETAPPAKSSDVRTPPPVASGAAGTSSVATTAGTPATTAPTGPITNPVPSNPAPGGSPAPTTPPNPRPGTGGTGVTPPATMPPPTTPAGPPPSVTGNEPKVPPKLGEPCPMLQTGMVKIAGTDVQLWVGQKVEGKKGPVFFYWHGTGGSSSEASRMSTAIREIMSEGGIMASFNQTTKKGMNTGNNVWYTGDFEMADHILACAVEQGLSIDMRRIYTGGCSAGGLQAGAMVYGRSSYLAAAMPNSGGTVFPSTLQDPMHVPALITTHGKMGTDVVGIDFSTTSLSECRDIAKKGGFAVDCDHGGRHCGATAEVTNAQWEFLKQHPFGVSPEPYANGLPPSFPQYCTIIK